MPKKDASTQALQAEYLAKQAREIKQERLKGLLTNRRLVLGGLVTIGLAAVLGVAWTQVDRERPARRSGAQTGKADAARLIARGRLIIHFVDGAKISPITDRGKAWSQGLRRKFGIAVVRRTIDAMPPGDWRGYYKAYNEVVIAAARETHGPDVFERSLED